MTWRPILCFRVLCSLVAVAGLSDTSLLCGQDVVPQLTMPSGTNLPIAPPVLPEDRPLPINLRSALNLANIRAIDVEIAAERVRVGKALLEQAQVLWLPTITLGGDYARHDGRIQDTRGNVFDASRSSMMLGVGSGLGPAATININDAIFGPLVARQQLRARESDQQTASNDTLVTVSDAYFTVQQARGELAGALDATRRTEELLESIRKLAPGMVPDLEVDRVVVELTRRQQAEVVARQHWQVASADLVRVLRLDPQARVEPVEPPQLRVRLIDASHPLEELLPVALMFRPEMASQQAQVQAALAQLRQEKVRPLVPSLQVSGTSTPMPGTLAAGVYGGGSNSSMGNGGLRGDVDIQLLWQLDNLGLGNRGRVHQREAENHQAELELVRLQDRIAAEVIQARAQAQAAESRMTLAEKEVRVALDSVDKNLAALAQPRRVGNAVQLYVRPAEAILAVQALSQAYADYYGAVADANRAQFRLYRALGKPAQCLTQTQATPQQDPNQG
jgi:outer membrane protein TolC